MSYDILHHVFPNGGISFPSIPVSADFPTPDLLSCDSTGLVLPSLWWFSLSQELHDSGAHPCPSSSCWRLKPPELAPWRPQPSPPLPALFIPPAGSMDLSLASVPSLSLPSSHLFLVRVTPVLRIPSLILFCYFGSYSP